MTTPRPAQSRPPPSIPPPPTLLNSLRRRLSVQKFEPDNLPKNTSLQPASDAEDEGRAAKRRKIESPSTLSQVPSQPAQKEDGNDKGIPPPPSKMSGLLRNIPDVVTSDHEKGETPSDSRPPPAFPDRPWKNRPKADVTLEENNSGVRTRKCAPVPNTPDKLESPGIAPRFGKRVGKCALAGFFPWVGKHPEDVLNETTAKNGYFDRAPAQLDREQGSAKICLHSAFKHRFGLDTLSALFSVALEQRTKLEEITSGSAFKPPPRVTLTETRRKAWLADLANVEIPLRRLSKTVPQGIRGQALLDQCLTNSIPISRAIWFVKCVGANEIRILQRQGATGNTSTGHCGKWFKDWTLNVEQFILAVTRQCGESGWRSNVQYTLRLCTQLYHDNLLDRDHYLDWMVKSLASAESNQTPFWLMIINVYYRDLIRFRKRGKKLAEALLEKITLVKNTNEKLLTPLISRLSDLVRRFSKERPLCFLMPEKWPQLREALRSCITSEPQTEVSLLDHLEKINERTLGANKLQDSNVLDRQKCIELLDNAKAPFNITALSDSCMQACPSPETAISMVMEWATTRFRHSNSRIYVASRLLRRWSVQGLPVESQILHTLGLVKPHATVDSEQFRHLVLELSRSKSFSVSRYLQWLTIKGGLPRDCFGLVAQTDRTSSGSESEDYRQNCKDSWQLLTEISIDHLDSHVRNLRNTNLLRAGYDLKVEGVTIENCKAFLSESMPTIFQTVQSPPMDTKTAAPSFASLSWSMKSSLSHWLRNQVVTHCKMLRNPELEKDIASTSSLDIQEFHIIRGALEQMGDIAVLADVLNALTASTQEDLLAAIADTVHHHVECFSAIGAFETLQEKLCQTYLALRNLRRSMPFLATSLIALCKQYPSRVVSVRTMQTDLVKGDRIRAVSAFSPFSDGVAESLQQAGETFLEDFESILQSESNMNEETMTRLFTVLAERIAKIGEQQDDCATGIALCLLLARLRLHRNVQCDMLILTWLGRLLSAGHSTISTLLTHLIGTSCVTFDQVVHATRNVYAKQRKGNTLTQTISTLFSCDGPDWVKSSVQYRLNLARTRYISEKPLEVLTLASEIKSVFSIDLKLDSMIPGLVSNIVMHGLSKEISTRQPEFLLKGLDHMLQLPEGKTSSTVLISAIAESVDDVSLPFCQTRLQLLIEQSLSDTSTTDEVAETFFAVCNAKAEGPSIDYFALLRGANPEIMGRIRRKAEEAFFTSLPALIQPKTASQTSPPSQDSIWEVQRYLNIAFGASQNLGDTFSTSSSSQLIDTISVLLKALGSVNGGATTASSPVLQGPASATHFAVANAATPQMATPEHLTMLLSCLPLLLQMTCLQRSALSTTGGVAPSKQAQQDQVKILVRLVSIALHPALSDGEVHDAADLVSFTLDVAATLVDELSDEARSICAHFLKEKLRDERVAWLLGGVNTMGSVMSKAVGEGLQVVKEGRGVVGEWRPRQWEIIEAGGGMGGETWVGLGMFGGRKG